MGGAVMTTRRCRRPGCGRRLGANNRSGVCSACLYGHSSDLCRVCEQPKRGSSSVCEPCRRALAWHGYWVGRDVVRPPPDVLAERIELYRGRAERGLPLFEAQPGDYP